MPRHRVLAISKPVVPPWSDSSKNLVRDLLLGAESTGFRVLTDGTHRFGLPHVREVPVYASNNHYSPTVWQNARIVSSIVRSNKREIHHYFYAPNRRTASVAKVLETIKRNPSIQTICSVPHSFHHAKQLFFADVNVALSTFTANRLREAGVNDVRIIRPSTPQLQRTPRPTRESRQQSHPELPDTKYVVLYPGDYSFSDTAVRVAEAALRLKDNKDIGWVFACRIKDDDSLGVEQAVKRMLRPIGERVCFLNHVNKIIELLAACDLTVLPAESTYAKMDIPLVLLEAMALGRPVIVSNRPPIAELADLGGALASEAGSAHSLADNIVALLEDEAEYESWSDRGARVVAESFDRTQTARAYEAIYRDLS
ncbi:MAG: glycosyltransferase family 4 protein [Myxococcales bacterium]|nr:glycosyltransferase family 4 protein [Myxococcales bacterium]